MHNLLKVVTLAPCFVAPGTVPHDIEDTWKMQELGIYAAKGPNWDRDFQTICDNFGEEQCQSTAELLKTSQPYSLQDTLHWSYNAH